MMNVARRALRRTFPSNYSLAAARLFSSYFHPLFKSPVRLKLLFSKRSEVITRWPTMPCLCFRASTTYRRPSLEGEQVEQRTTALQRLWRQRWAEGSFMQALKPGAHPHYFNVSQCFHRSQDGRPTFSKRRKKIIIFGKAQDHTCLQKKKECFESVLFSYQQNIKGPVNIYQNPQVRRAWFCFVFLPYSNTENLCSKSTKKTQDDTFSQWQRCSWGNNPIFYFACCFFNSKEWLQATRTFKYGTESV